MRMTEDAGTDMELQQENQRLRDENKLLQTRVRGFNTLGELLHQKRTRCAELEKQLEALQQQLDTTSLAAAPPPPLPAQTPAPAAVESVATPSLGEEKQTSLPTGTAAMSAPELLSNLNTAPDDDLFSGPGNAGAATKGSSIMQESLTEAQTTPAQEDEDETVVIRTPPVTSALHITLHTDTTSFTSPVSPPRPAVTKSESMVTGLGSVQTFPSLSSTESYQMVTRPRLSVEETVLPRAELPSESDLDLNNLMSVTDPEELANHLKNMSADILKLGHQKEKYKKYIDTVNKENRHIKVELNESKEENHRLLRRIKRLEHERDNMPPVDSISPSRDWVHVEKTQTSADPGETAAAGDATALQARVRSLEATNKKLLAANQEWQEKWTSLERQAQGSHAALQRQLEDAERELLQLRSAGDQGRSELEDMLMQAKARASELEGMLEDKTEEMEAVNARLQNMEERYNATQQQLSALNRENTSYRTELEVLQTRRPAKTPSSKTLEELKTDNMVLRQQLKVFEEDFERERADRAQAQASCDDFKTQVDMLKREKNELARKNRSLTDELRAKDAAVRQGQGQITKLQAKVKQLSAQLKEANSRFSVTYPPAQIYPQVYVNPQPPPFGFPGIHPGVTMRMGGMMGRPQTVPSDLLGQHSPERLHGSWTCISCTYVNYPGRVICEMCGTDNTTQLRRGHTEISQGNAANPHLMSRSGNTLGQGTDLQSAQPDLVCDSMDM